MNNPNTNNNKNNNIFFTIKTNDNETQFNSREYSFAIKDNEQQFDSKSNCVWWYEFPESHLGLKWISWNTNNNGVKEWEYLLLKINDVLYSGFINKAKQAENVYYCELKPLPPKLGEVFV